MKRLQGLYAASARWIILLGLLFMIMGCLGEDIVPENDVPEEETSDAGQVGTFDSETQLETYLKDQYAKSVYPNTYTKAGMEGLTPAGDDNYSQTNIQEVGVDESDVVKTDGANFYVSDQKSFHVVDISDPMQVVATRTVNGDVESLYLYDQKLIVLYTLARAGGEPWPDVALPASDGLFGMPYWIPVEKRQGVAIFDISDPSNPDNIKTVEFDGHLASSRLISGKLHIIQQFVPDLPPLEYTHDGTQEDLDGKIEANKAAMADVPLDQLIPYYREIGDAPGSPADRPLVSPQNFYSPLSEDGGGTITTVVSFDLDDPELGFASVGIVANAHIVYASTQALYIATHKYDTEILSLDFGADRAKEATIYKFGLSGQAVQYVGRGAVDGWILNQFSLGEYQDVLRVATTTGHVWNSTSRNHVYCLELEEQTLKTIGSIEDLAPGETIYSARFMGERGYLVTYVTIDPLFTLDLSDPSAPEVAGYLKVPGYSDYIHPYGDNHLITLGKDALFVEEEKMAWYQGVQLSIFDVTDFANPVLLHKELIGDRGTSSEALYNHKAFTFWSANDLLALPISLYEHPLPPNHPSQQGEKTFEGLYVYRISSNSGFNLLGRISTRNNNAIDKYNRWTRGIFVDQQVYAVTDNAVRSAQIDQIEESVKTLYVQPANEGNVEETESAQPREMNPTVSQAQMNALVAGNTRFALDLYWAAKESKTGNLFYSPFSISIALAMTCAGAENNTKAEMADVLGFTLPEDELHAAFNALDLELSTRGTGDASQFRLNSANALWGQKNYHYEKPFLDTLAQHYGSGLNLLDFIADPDSCRMTINDWVEDKTEHHIVDLLPENAITSLTRLVLTNAVYFWGQWDQRFPKETTSSQLFHKDDGSDVATDFMNTSGAFNYYAGTGYEVLELPYKGNDTSMILIGPDAGTMKRFEATLNPSLVDTAMANLTPTFIDLSMPKFKFSYQLDLTTLLQQLGMTAPFNSQVADFSGINGLKNLFISDVFHKAFVAVDEEGTEAAAATGVVVGVTSAPPAGIRVTLNRPFIFLIRDRVSGTILFLGRLADPGSNE
jgi:serpin B